MCFRNNNAQDQLLTGTQRVVLLAADMFKGMTSVAQNAQHVCVWVCLVYYWSNDNITHSSQHAILLPGAPQHTPLRQHNTNALLYKVSPCLVGGECPMASSAVVFSLPKSVSSSATVNRQGKRNPRYSLTCLLLSAAMRLTQEWPNRPRDSLASLPPQLVGLRGGGAWFRACTVDVFGSNILVVFDIGLLYVKRQFNPYPTAFPYGNAVG